jgi:hypothetical protein
MLGNIMFELLLFVYVFGLLIASLCVELKFDDDTVQDIIDKHYDDHPEDTWKPSVLQLRIMAPMLWPVAAVGILLEKIR